MVLDNDEKHSAFSEAGSRNAKFGAAAVRSECEARGRAPRECVIVLRRGA